MRTVFCSLILTAAVAGCQQQEAGEIPAPQTVDESQPAETNEKPANSEVMAYVNGEPIYMSRLTDILIRGYGRGISQQLVATELVRQAVRAEGATATDADIQAESDRTLKGIFGEVPESDQRERLLRQFQARSRITGEQWELIIRRNAMLRKLAERQVAVTDEQLREAFGQRYGRKFVVRHIQVGSLDEAQKMLKTLDEGADFAELARKHSAHPSGRDGGLLPPISDKTPGVIGQATRAMKKKGEISDPILVGEAFHILKLEEIIEPKDVKFEDVRDELAAAVREESIAVLQRRIMIDLVRNAQKEGQIKYVNPVVKALAEKTANATERPQP
ncbi:MAG: peptidylprolyl isomerase [Phycisphaerae bacterium]|nr:peptidylprolyl isomerase [Phycisphaerae bacterium]